MQYQMLQAKIHRATVTDSDLQYEGSITIDLDLIEAAGMREYQKVQVVDINNGSRFETYIMNGSRGSGTVCINGAAARLVHRGDLVIIFAYCLYDETELDGYAPKIILVDDNNRIRQVH
ncbi:MAG TPA: aspartate 1-decarboxylase [Spirochaetota bacterium]|nr:aspartate 1-decarboxylase [Spirochaetota bacterium]HPH03279.1 aspartate 1-decarboxylase [Spirochaetota bacterium]